MSNNCSMQDDADEDDFDELDPLYHEMMDDLTDFK